MRSPLIIIIIIIIRGAIYNSIYKVLKSSILASLIPYYLLEPLAHYLINFLVLTLLIFP